jgi:hypothetical protein
MIFLAVGAGNGDRHADNNPPLSPILIRKKKNLHFARLTANRKVPIARNYFDKTVALHNL